MPSTLYKDRPEWRDIKPILQNEASGAVCRIAYTDEFKDVYNYFRAIIAKDEKSERALELTKSAIQLNPANYTVWQFRREILKALKKDISEEMNFLSEIIMEQQKNYQVWQHRRALVEWSQDASKELEFTADIIFQDQKNYHAWQHRQWVIKEFSLWDDELKYVEGLLRVDVRNNSAWNQRYFVVKHTTGFTSVRNREIEFTLNKINKALHNESAWNYLRGVLEVDGLNSSEQVNKKVLEWKEEKMQSPQFLAFTLSMIEENIENENYENFDEKIQEAKQICEQLCMVDTIRRKYWNFIIERMKTYKPQ